MTEYRLYSAVWEITLACCFSCRYCGSAGSRARDNELTTDECVSVAEQLAELGCERVSLIGGEIFMRPDWLEICTALSGRGIRVNIITNGFLFTDRIINDLRNARIESVSVSLDGPKDVHDKYRQNGSYDRALLALHTLRDAGIPVSVISTLNSENVLRLDELLEVLRYSGIYAWQLQACSPMGNAASNGVAYAFDPRHAIGFVEKHMNSVPFALGVADNIGYFGPSEGSIRGNRSGKAYFMGCRAGISSVGIDSAGNVRGCESMYDSLFNEGNLREKTLREIWEDENAFRYNRGFVPSLLTGACADCGIGPYCAGGCRSYNYFCHGKLYEAPRCARALDLTDKELSVIST
jgi:radical SAM protein with 4Fe4S-binding SPASM domain